MLRLSTPGQSRFVQTDTFDVNYGGGEANVAVSCANYGHEAYFVSKLPKHEIGQAAVNALRRYGVRTDYIARGGNRVGIYYLETGASMRPSKVIYDRAGSSIAEACPEDFDFDAIMEGADWFHWSGITPAISDASAECLRLACIAAKKHGVTVSCDLNFRKNLWTYGKSATEVMPSMVEKSDVIFGAMSEYRFTLGVNDVPFKATDSHYVLDRDVFLKECRMIESRYPRCRSMFIELRNSMSVNHDVLAAVLYSKGVLHVAPVYDIDGVVDKVGVGDAFVGGMIHGLLAYPDDGQKALNFALAASALKNTVYGDFNQVSVAEVESLMQGNRSGRVSR